MITYHDAGHAVAAHLLGGRITGPLSIRQTKRWRGVCHVRAPRLSSRDIDRIPFDLPLAVFPPPCAEASNAR